MKLAAEQLEILRHLQVMPAASADPGTQRSGSTLCGGVFIP
jgi:undecaprenyl pyrophosphate phosphatase UppP